ncbi:DUF397 domain-containing protein [Streptomyces europaeiscabiei]|uniref:DUF397 domain-containing protein n=1 Tax=Streptomyces europaeiscabiei TaxID=146819 RepID=A0ABU4NC37_9ACTN|nr:DUF397 domain-containing protein [Streptomyces europaeiscabiei]MDX2526684.1 DUF397 domain-containing protein [Streptomyces europaeiscabiei]MDX2764962.1 DUF397 domain-containing protein [Streptomyces europaeiscabiei]MDX2774320.1 DUF397 domain-containing protein [Streptomyces europaeiscabiei]MDX3541551.1 DUF397 domain-containing protein [Streptomyces europaeiscabiei]MDX3551892.1 DUF397 domain-containing protein [Streptomyces europaeiscabiei]
MPIRSEHQWFKSSYSGGSGTECVETALIEDGAAVRDSKDLSTPWLAFSRRAWAGFITAIEKAEI